MTLIYITGLPGVGKSTIAHELKRQGAEAHSADEDGFNGFYNKETGQKHIHQEDDVKYHTPEWDAKYEWRTDEDKVKELKKNSEGRIVYLSGVSANQNEILKIVDKVIYLHVDESTLKHRLASRDMSNFGKAPHELELIFALYKTSLDEHKSINSIIIDATQSVEKIVDDIIGALG